MAEIGRGSVADLTPKKTKTVIRLRNEQYKKKKIRIAKTH
jgi:hypothetical protein